MAKANAKPKAKKTPIDMLLVGSKVRAMIRAEGFNTGSDAIEGLNAFVAWLVQQGAKRAYANGRRTVRAYDFLVP